MPLPHWLAQINKRVFNPREIRRGKRPVLTHVGRNSGKTYATPIEVFPVKDGYLIVVMYGASRSDWVKNVLKAGTASLRVDGKDVGLVSPRVLTGRGAWQRLPSTFKRPPKFMNVTELLEMDVHR